MIISHTQKLVFIKSKKSAGTSFEIALSKHCGPDCILTPISPKDEAMRLAPPFRPAQNYANGSAAGYHVAEKDGFFNHIPLPWVKKSIPQDIWQTYRKVAIFRDPFDVAISRYYWRKKSVPHLNFGQFFEEYPNTPFSNSQILPVPSYDSIDLKLRYATLTDDARASGLGFLCDDLATLKAKGGVRPADGTSPAEIYAQFPETAARIAQESALEIAYFGYKSPLD